jgi:hypothetical protein
VRAKPTATRESRFLSHGAHSSGPIVGDVALRA